MLPETISPFKTFRPIKKEKFKKLKKYLKKNLAKNFVRKLILPIKHAVFFALKKNNNNRLYIDYRKINNITIKNRYSISSIKKLQDRIQKTIIFIIVDLRWAYYLIKIKKKRNKKSFFEFGTDTTSIKLYFSN